MKLIRLTRKQIIRRTAAIIILASLIVPGLYNKLRVVNYKIESSKIEGTIRLALITDLHSCRYGDHESELISSLDEANPDIVLLGGDIFDEDSNNENAIDFLAGIAGRYPVYYVTGNHEFWGGAAKYENYMNIIEEYGITRLQGQIDTLDINGNSITIAGVDDYDAYLVDSDLILENQFVEAYLSLSADSFNVILSHRPDYFDTYEAQDYDLALCGHTHGGQWRIPLFLNGLYVPNQGLFPEYAGGIYSKDTTTMIVSRGLARESTLIPRFYNRPELVIVDIT